MGTNQMKCFALLFLTIFTTNIFSKESSRAKAIAYIEVVNDMNTPAAFLTLDDQLKQKVGFDALNFLLFERSKFLRNQKVKKVLIEEKRIQYNAGELLDSFKFKSTSDKKKTIIDEIIIDSQNNIISYEVKFYKPDERLDESTYSLPYVDENERILISKHLLEFNKMKKVLDQKKYYKKGFLFFYKPEKRSNFYKEIDIRKVKKDLGIYSDESLEFLNSEGIKYRIIKSKILNQTYVCKNKAKIFYFLVDMKSEKPLKKILRAYRLNNSKIKFQWTQYREEMLNSDSFIDMINFDC
ncbi:hypothetical protein [Leptospira yanagawae]|nr:hypothetical protein [Leptospira yanagawae]